MAALTSTLVAGAGLTLNAYQTYSGVQQEEAAAKSAADIGAQQKMLAEQNRVAGVQVPQLGYQLAQESGAQRTANQVQALQGAGTAAILGGLPGINQQATAQDLQLAAQLDQAKYERDTFVAQQEQAIQARDVNRQNEFLSTQLQGAQLRRAEGQSNINSGISGAAGILGDMAVQYEKNKALYDKEKADAAKAAPNKLDKPQPVLNPEKLLNQYPAVDLPAPKNPMIYGNSSQYNPLAAFQMNPVGQSDSQFKPYYVPDYLVTKR